MVAQTNVTISPPTILSFKNVMFWHPVSKTLLEMKKNGDTKSGTLISKAKKFLQLGCIKRMGTDFVCLPLEGYNKTRYTITNLHDGYECNCQGYSKNGYCSHILAVQQLTYMEEYNAS